MNERRMRRLDEHQRRVAAAKLDAQSAALSAAALVLETAATDDDLNAINDAARETARAAAIAYYRSKDFETAMAHAIRESAKDLVAEEVAARVPEMQERVRARIAESFDRVVEQVAREQLDRALADLRSNFATVRKA